jgi:hypothetical protein
VLKWETLKTSRPGASSPGALTVQSMVGVDHTADRIAITSKFLPRLATSVQGEMLDHAGHSLCQIIWIVSSSEDAAEHSLQSFRVASAVSRDDRKSRCQFL